MSVKHGKFICNKCLEYLIDNKINSYDDIQMCEFCEDFDVGHMYSQSVVLWLHEQYLYLKLHE